jgi:hypothetical protein
MHHEEAHTKRLEELLTEAVPSIRTRTLHLLKSGAIDTSEDNFRPIKIAFAAALINEAYNWEPFNDVDRKVFHREVKNCRHF